MMSGLYGSKITIDYAGDSEAGLHRMLSETCHAVIINIILPDGLKLISLIPSSLRGTP
jgi:hypothetical protein